MNLKLALPAAAVLGAWLGLTGGTAMAEENALSSREGSIAEIAAFTATGQLGELEAALHRGLDHGLSVSEIKEVLVQLYAYCGFPRSLNAMQTFMKVYDSRPGLNEGEAPSVLGSGTDRHAYGSEVQTRLIGKPAQGRYIEFAPALDDFLKEHLFADIFARGVLSHADREIATIAALNALATVRPQLEAHIAIGRNTGLSEAQIAGILRRSSAAGRGGPFGLGEDNAAYARYFTGSSYLQPLTEGQLHSSNVTFEPGCRNHWHIHHQGGQVLYATQGRGYYQEWGKEAQELLPGDVVSIPPGVKHWHGAAPDSWFSHIAIAVPAEGASSEWLEPVDDEHYAKLR